MESHSPSHALSQNEVGIVSKERVPCELCPELSMRMEIAENLSERQRIQVERNTDKTGDKGPENLRRAMLLCSRASLYATQAVMNKNNA